MKSYSWEEMMTWGKTSLIGHIRALEHELARPVEHRQKIEKRPPRG